MLAEVFPAMKSGRGLPAGHTVPRLARESGAGPPQAFTGTPSVSGTPLEGRLASEAASGPVIVPGARSRDRECLVCWVRPGSTDGSARRGRAPGAAPARTRPGSPGAAPHRRGR